MKLILVFVAGVILAAFLYVGTKIARAKPELPFVPSPNNGKEILTRGWSEAELNKILEDFVAIYPGRLGNDFLTEKHVTDSGCIRVTFPHDIPALLFSFLVNYVQYPKDFDLKTRSILVVGKAPLSGDFPVPDPKYAGRPAMFYLPSQDRDFDLVYVRIDNETFENSFASDTWKKVNEPRTPIGIEDMR